VQLNDGPPRIEGHLPSERASASSETPANIQQSRPQAISWQVTEEFSLVRVRSAPTFTADTLSQKRKGTTLQGFEVGGWIQLIGEPGYIAITDGSGKQLLRRAPEVGHVDEAGEMPMGAVISIKQDRCIDDEEECLEVEIISKTDEHVIVMLVEEPGELYVVDIEEPVILRRKTAFDEETLRRKTEEVIALAATEDSDEGETPIAKGATAEDAEEGDSPVALVVEETPPATVMDMDKAGKPRKSRVKFAAQSTQEESFMNERLEEVHHALTEAKQEAANETQASERTRRECLRTHVDRTFTNRISKDEMEWEKGERSVTKRTPRSLKSLISRDVIRRYERNALTMFSDEHNQSFCSNTDVTPEPVQLSNLSTKDLTDYMKKKNGKSPGDLRR